MPKQKNINKPTNIKKTTKKPAKKDNIDTLKQELADAQASAKKNWQQVLLLTAEIENQQKRHSKAITNAHKYALDNFIRELLTVKDSLDLGLQNTKTKNTNVASMQKGLAMIDKAFTDALSKFGVDIINPLGEKFNPEFHEAMTTIAAPNKPSQEIVEVIQIGMSLNNRLIRAAKVIVAQ